MYLAVRNHFNTDSYDYYKYNGKTGAKASSFDKRKDKWVFVNLVNKYPDPDDLLNHFIGNFVFGKMSWPGDLVSDEADTSGIKWISDTDKLSEIVSNDISYMAGLIYDGEVETLDSFFQVIDGQHPRLLKEYFRSSVHILSLIALDKVFPYLKKWNRLMEDDIIWPDIYKLFIKTERFIDIDIEKIRGMLQVEFIE